MLMLHLMLVFAVGDMFRAKLIRCHRTELTSAATLSCMGRTSLGLSVCSLIRITNKGRLCAHDYPGPVSGDSLESRFDYIWIQSPFGTMLLTMRWSVAMRWQVSGGHRGTEGMTCEACQVIW